MNFLTGVVILLALYANVTAVNTDQIVGLAPELAQQETGLQEGDLIYKVDGYRTYLAGDAALFLQYADDTVDVEVIRDGEHVLIEDLQRPDLHRSGRQQLCGFRIDGGRLCP